MSVLEAGLRLRTGPLPTSPRPLPLTQMKVGAGAESASQVRVTLSRPSRTGAEAELRTVALGETEKQRVREVGDLGADGRQQSWVNMSFTHLITKSTEALIKSQLSVYISPVSRYSSLASKWRLHRPPLLPS